MKKTVRSWIGKNLFAAVTILLSAAMLTVFLRTEKGLRNFRHAFTQLRPVWLIWIAVGVLAGWFLESYVLHLFCRHLNGKWTFGRSFYIGMTGLFYSAVTPFSMGEPMEVYNMTKMGMDTGAATSIVAVKSLVHHAVTFVYSLLLVLFELSYFQTRVSNFSFVTVFGLLTNSIFIAAVIMFMVNERLTDSVLRGIVKLLDKIKLHRLSQKFYRKVREQLLIFHDSSKKMGKSLALYAAAVSLTLVQITIASLISYFVYRSFNLKGESVFIMVAADTFVTMVASFVPSPGSTGGAEGGFYLFFHDFFGESIVPAITLWRLATYFANILFGGAVVFMENRKYNSQETQQ
jgi:uncharacterized protein (TIRG00374 family)